MANRTNPDDNFIEAVVCIQKSSFLNWTCFFNLITQIVRWIVNRQEHEAHMNTLEEQRNEFGNTIDLKMLNLEINWRNLEVQGGHGEFNFSANSDAYTAIINSTASGVNTGGGGARQPPCFWKFCFFCSKKWKKLRFWEYFSDKSIRTNMLRPPCFQILRY